ncbi:hypothetical protein KPL71_014068 [Citrus sinensis]|uniref:Uncharacterized protein n=1 Tax=Citrus sinensis TaxID=2711 RepID=A0ACB8K963_CITSI|nr:hypothetical protein KPL71_014068 [Citrus sinensis]
MSGSVVLAPQRKKKVCSCFPATCFGFKQIFIRHDIAVKIQEINEELDDIAIQKDKFKFVESASKGSEKPGRVQSTSLIDEEEICGRVDEKNELLSKLLCESSEQQKGLHIISIVGMGGIGKTTLAQLASNHDEVNRQFDKILWVCVSDTFDEFRVAKVIVEALDGHEFRLEQEKEMEIIGEEYFGILASRSFFQDFKKDDDDNIVRCKMHDIVHDFVQFLSQNECLSIEINGGEESSLNSLDGKVCHLMVNLGYNAASFPAVATGRLKRLYSLLIDGHNNIDNSSLIEFLQELFSESRCLRALDFGYPPESSDMIREILTNAEKLVHLRYLNLNGQVIKGKNGVTLAAVPGSNYEVSCQECRGSKEALDFLRDAIPVAICQFINISLNKFDNLIIVLEQAASVAKTFLRSQAPELNLLLWIS